MAQTNITCPECGYIWKDEQTCTDYFHMMCFWELDHQLYDVHHLMILSYYLQHPSQLSQEWLNGAKLMLVDFLENGITPQEIRQRIALDVDSGKRTYKIKATPESSGKYEHPIQWTMTTKDVVAGGIEEYYANVQAWAKSILDCLRQSDNLSDNK